MPSADFCTPQPHLAVRSCHFVARVQISQGKTRDLRPNPAAYTHRHSWMTLGLKTNASSPMATRLVYGLCTSVRGFACSFLQIPPPGRHPCCSARSSCHRGLRGTFTPKSLPIFVSFHGYPAPVTALRAMPGARRVARAGRPARALARSVLMGSTWLRGLGMLRPYRIKLIADLHSP